MPATFSRDFAKNSNIGESTSAQQTTRFTNEKNIDIELNWQASEHSTDDGNSD